MKKVITVHIVADGFLVSKSLGMKEKLWRMMVKFGVGMFGLSVLIV